MDEEAVALRRELTHRACSGCAKEKPVAKGALGEDGSFLCCRCVAAAAKEVLRKRCEKEARERVLLREQKHAEEDKAAREKVARLREQKKMEADILALDMMAKARDRRESPPPAYELVKTPVLDSRGKWEAADPERCKVCLGCKKSFDHGGCEWKTLCKSCYIVVMRRREALAVEKRVSTQA
jgi:hypothetical protein